MSLCTGGISRDRRTELRNFGFRRNFSACARSRSYGIMQPSRRSPFQRTRASTSGPEASNGRQPQEGPGRSARPDREAVRQGLGHAPRRCRRHVRRRSRVDGLARARHRARRRRLAARPRRRDLRPGIVRQDDARAHGRSPRRRKSAARPRSSTPSTRSIRPMPRSSASTSTSCWSRSRTPASRRSKSPTCWCAPARSTSSSSTRSRR